MSSAISSDICDPNVTQVPNPNCETRRPDFPKFLYQK